MKKLTLNEIATLERAIKEKYGEIAVINPKQLWTEELDTEYHKQLSDLTKKQRKLNKNERVNVDGILVSKRLIIKDAKRKCPICGIYSFNPQDDVYMNRFDCCFQCFVKWVEGREERWATGWRPGDK